jgi:hypothetical protein
MLAPHSREASRLTEAAATARVLPVSAAVDEHSVFTTVRWNALDAEGQVLRDTRTTYHLLATPDGWRLLSYTNHF